MSVILAKGGLDIIFHFILEDCCQMCYEGYMESQRSGSTLNCN